MKININIISLATLLLLMTGCSDSNKDPAPIELWEEKLNLWCNEANWNNTDRQRFSELTLGVLPQYYKTGKALNSPWISPEHMKMYNDNNLKYHVDNCATLGKTPQLSASPQIEQDNQAFTAVLDKFEEMVAIYEGYAKKDPLCMQDIIEINGQVLLKLNDISAQANQLKNTSPQPSKIQLDRYIQVSTRMSQAMLALSSSMKKPVMCQRQENIQNETPNTPSNEIMTAPEVVTESVVEPVIVAPVTPEAMPINTPSPTPEEVIPAQPVTPTVDQPALLSSNNIVTIEEPVKPSFDCAKASNYAEKTICANPNLAKLDSQLSELYRKVKSTTNNPSELKTEQMSWLKGSRRCTDEDCLMQAYQMRIEALSKQ